MTNAKRLLLMALLALTALAAATASASAAANFRISPAGTIRQFSQGRITFEGGGLSISCILTINGRLSAGPITAALDRQFGELNEVAILRPCAGGEVARVLFELGTWPITLRGVLELDARLACTIQLVQPERANPRNLCGILFRIRGVRFQLSVFGGAVNCLYGSETAIQEVLAQLLLTERAGVYTIGLLIVKPAPIRGNSGGLCPATGEMRGIFLPSSPEQTVIVE